MLSFSKAPIPFLFSLISLRAHFSFVHFVRTKKNQIQLLFMYYSSPDIKSFADMSIANDFCIENPLYNQKTSQDIE